MNRPLIVIAGPTGSGKSDLAIRLAKDIHGVIINGDSRQIYKELSIGTAKPNEHDMDNVQHFLYDKISVKEKYSIYQYQKDVFSLLETIPENITPIIVGGTGLYIDSVVFNYKLSESSKAQRSEFESLSIDQLQKKIPADVLNKLNTSDIQNPRRLIRIIEKGDTSFERGLPFTHKYFVVDIPKEELRKRIVNRVEKMIKEGLIEENQMVREKKFDKYPALNSIGYKEFDGYFEGKKDIEKVKEELVTNTIKYAKRQRTWFRRNPDAIWTNDYDLILKESRSLIESSLQS